MGGTTGVSLEHAILRSWVTSGGPSFFVDSLFFFGVFGFSVFFIGFSGRHETPGRQLTSESTDLG